VEKERVQERAKRADPAKAGKLSATTKMMIAVYALILVAVAILIIAASVAAAKRGEDAAALQAQSAALETTLQNQEREISGLLDISANDPQFSDYESAGAGKTFELKPLKNETAYEPIRGWFDRLCDFFSN
jgi:cell division protein FtsL